MTPEELRGLYEAVVKSSGHPDPIGYMARAMVFSDSDPDYIDVEGRQGFMPVHPDRAMQSVGSRDVQSLQGNVATTMAMDIMYFDQFGSLRDMMVAFHEGPDAVGSPLSAEMKELMDALPELRDEIKKVVSPRLATVDDVIKILTRKTTVSKKRIEAFKDILNAI